MRYTVYDKYYKCKFFNCKKLIKERVKKINEIKYNQST
jgi:hypothetical protein